MSEHQIRKLQVQLLHMGVTHCDAASNLVDVGCSAEDIQFLPDFRWQLSPCCGASRTSIELSQRHMREKSILAINEGTIRFLHPDPKRASFHKRVTLSFLQAHQARAPTDAELEEAEAGQCWHEEDGVQKSSCCSRLSDWILGWSATKSD